MRAVVAAAALLSVLPPYRLSAQDSTRIAEAQSVLAQLVETYGVSGTEGPVREAVKRLLPSWAKSETDTAGNLWVRVGQGSPVVVVIAHLDEIGFRVTGIRDDGTLELETRGGFISSLFEGKPALVHTDQGDIAGVFLPRDSGFTRHTPPPLRVDVGAGSRAKAMARGVSLGQTVTMPKQYVRLSGTRATGRSFDDRVGATAQRNAGATVFLTPAGNCPDTAGAIPAGLKVVKVSTLSQAISDLEALKAGKPVPSC